MARLSCCLLFSLSVLLSGQAEAWGYPWIWCRAGDTSGEEAGLIQQEDSAEVGGLDDGLMSYPELYLLSLPPELQGLFVREGITAELLAHVCTDKDLCKKLNLLLKEMACFVTDDQQKHHQLLRFVISFMSLIGGAINRIAAYPGLLVLFTMMGVPSPFAEAMAGIITGCALMSSNMLAVTGANSIRCEGYQDYQDVLVTILAGTATGVDCGMAYKGLTAISDSPALGGVGVVFMAVGLLPLLSNKVENLPDTIRGRDPAAEQLLERTVHMLGQLLRSMKADGVGVGRDQLQARMVIYQSLFGVSGSKSCWRWLLKQCCLYSPEDRMKNTARLLCESGVLNEDLGEGCSLPEFLFQRALDHRKSTAGTLANAGLLIICAGPAMVYVLADSSSLVALIERELSGLSECKDAGDTVSYVVLQGEALTLMASKGMASAQNGANNIRRIISWLRGCCTGQGTTATKSDYALNTLGGVMALFYGANNIGTMAGNILASPCLNEDGVALAILPAMAGLGGYGFNAGSGPELRKIPVTFYEFIQWARSCKCSACPPANKETMEFIQQLQAGTIDLPDMNDPASLASWIQAQGAGAVNTETVQNWLSVFEGFEGFETFVGGESSSLTNSQSSIDYGSGSASSVQEESDAGWLQKQGFSNNLLHIVGRDDRGNIDKKEKAYLQKLSELIRTRRFTVHPVARDGNCIFNVLIEMLSLQNQTVEQLQDRLKAKLIRLLNNRNLSPEEKSFLLRIGRQQLARLLRELQHGAQMDFVLLQLASLELGQDITVIQNDLGDMAIQQINHSNPAELNNISVDQINGPVAVHNGIGHWVWMTPGQDVIDGASFHAATGHVYINLEGNTNANNNQNNTCCNGTTEVLTMELNVVTVGILGAWMK
ncbi:MAG: OTU domain-containing protein [Endozoicomonas sp.]